MAHLNINYAGFNAAEGAKTRSTVFTYILCFAMLSLPPLGADAREVKWISVISADATVLADVPL